MAVRRQVLGRLVAFALAALWSALVPAPVLAQSEVGSTVVASGLFEPVQATYAPGDATRLFIVERNGRVRVVHNGTLLAAPFLDISSRVALTPGDRGLLGLAFHPQYATNGYFYVFFTQVTPTLNMVVRYQVTADRNVANAASAQTVMSTGNAASVHNGGWLGFGPLDGYLYISRGESASPSGGVQDINQLQGKMLRLDVNGDDFPTDSARNYRVPPSNPYVGAAGADEVWALGLRNPYRCAFDRLTGAFWISDVGGLLNHEEINFLPPGAGAGTNFGSPRAEGVTCIIAADPENPVECADFREPLALYEHNNGLCAVIGGPVYRGTALQGFAGRYFYADHCAKRVYSLYVDAMQFPRVVEHTSGINLSANADRVLGMGEDAQGEVYLCLRLTDGTGEVRKLVPCPARGCDAPCPADFNGDGFGTIADIFDFLALWFAFDLQADFDLNGRVNVADIFSFLSAWFQGC